jgi:hypothetical protein
MKGYPSMNVFSRSGVVVPLVSALSLFALPALAQNQPANPPPGTVQHQAKPQVQATRPPGGHPPAAVVGRGVPTARVYGGNPYRGRVAWEGGRWRHEVYQGRDGWWWDVGGVRYYYAEPMDGPPSYISDDYADDVGYPPPVAGAYQPPPAGYYPPPPPPDPGASALGGAIVGGVLGGLLTGRAAGAAAGAVVGGATGAIVGATAAARPGYYWSQGTCYYRYPSGQYVPADERACY